MNSNQGRGGDLSESKQTQETLHEQRTSPAFKRGRGTLKRNNQISATGLQQWFRRFQLLPVAPIKELFEALTKKHGLTTEHWALLAGPWIKGLGKTMFVLNISSTPLGSTNKTSMWPLHGLKNTFNFHQILNNQNILHIFYSWLRTFGMIARR